MRLFVRDNPRNPTLEILESRNEVGTFDNPCLIILSAAREHRMMRARARVGLCACARRRPERQSFCHVWLLMRQPVLINATSLAVEPHLVAPPPSHHFIHDEIRTLFAIRPTRGPEIIQSRRSGLQERTSRPAGGTSSATLLSRHGRGEAPSQGPPRSGCFPLPVLRRPRPLLQNSK